MALPSCNLIREVFKISCERSVSDGMVASIQSICGCMQWKVTSVFQWLERTDLRDDSLLSVNCTPAWAILANMKWKLSLSYRAENSSWVH